MSVALVRWSAGGVRWAMRAADLDGFDDDRDALTVDPAALLGHHTPGARRARVAGGAVAIGSPTENLVSDGVEALPAAVRRLAHGAVVGLLIEEEALTIVLDVKRLVAEATSG